MFKLVFVAVLQRKTVWSLFKVNYLGLIILNFQFNLSVFHKKIEITTICNVFKHLAKQA